MSQPLAYRPSNSAVYYQTPRGFDLPRLLMSLPVALLLAISAAWVYVWASDMVRHILLRIGFVALFGVAIGAITLQSLRFARVYRVTPAVLIAVLVGLVALHSAWIFWTVRTVELIGYLVAPLDLLRHPYLHFELVRMFNASGTWYYKSDLVNGVPLLVCWIIEAGIIVGCAIAVCSTVAGAPPICLACRVACKRQTDFGKFAADRDDEVSSQIEDRRYEFLQEMGPLRDDDDPHVELEIHSCPRCEQTNVLSVKRLAMVVNQEGQYVVHTTTLVNRLLVSRDDLEQIRAICQAAHAAGAESDPATDDDDPPDDEDTGESDDPPMPAEGSTAR